MIIESVSEPTFVEIIDRDLQKNEQYNKTLYWGKLKHNYIFYLFKLHIPMHASAPISQPIKFSSSFSIFTETLLQMLHRMK